jgi:2',3'-cyclic-nucleotide 2'-phosphodiesterase (5'-nucleotidase family)
MAMTSLRALRSRPLLAAAGAALFLLAVLALFVSDLPPTTPAQAAGDAPKIDPIAVNGAIFVDWPKPSLTIVITGELDGYLEPCGCAGLENQLGGLKRRYSFIKQLEADGWPVVKLDLGGLTKRTGEQAEIKYRYALESLVMMGYDAVGLGAKDAKLRTEYLAFAMENVDKAKNPIVSANLGVFDFEAAATMGGARYRIIEKGGKKVGVTAVFGAGHETIVKNNEFLEYLPPAEALATIAPQLAAEKCDVQVLLVHGNRQEAEALSRQFPQFQIVATAGGAEEPPNQPSIVDGSGAVLMEAGHKGMYATVLAFFDEADAKNRTRYQRVPLDVRFPDSPEMQAQLVKYQKELETMTLAGLGLTGVAHPDGEFAGSEACADCHTAAWDKFE